MKFLSTVATELRVLENGTLAIKFLKYEVDKNTHK